MTIYTMGEIDQMIAEAKEEGRRELREEWGKGVIAKVRQPGWGCWIPPIIEWAKREAVEMVFEKIENGNLGIPGALTSMSKNEWQSLKQEILRGLE